nr:hypothetical protein [Actinomycetota bacterium]NIU68289.1 hypothetical protein [Actinomycetota bacterium]NIW30104.1 hypothetical protein [Actinomycetota bacterium]
NTYLTDDPTSAMRIIASGFASAAGGSCDDIPTDNRNLSIVNNVFAATSAFGYVIPSNQPVIDGLTMTHNAWYAGPGVDVSAIGSDVPFAGEPASLYSMDPLFASPPGDLSPGTGSPLVGAGVAVPFVRGGYDGCWEGAPNIGAY